MKEKNHCIDDLLFIEPTLVSGYETTHPGVDLRETNRRYIRAFGSAEKEWKWNITLIVAVIVCGITAVVAKIHFHNGVLAVSVGFVACVYVVIHGVFYIRWLRKNSTILVECWRILDLFRSTFEEIHPSPQCGLPTPEKIKALLVNHAVAVLDAQFGFDHFRLQKERFVGDIMNYGKLINTSEAALTRAMISAEAFGLSYKKDEVFAAARKHIIYRKKGSAGQRDLGLAP